MCMQAIWSCHSLCEASACLPLLLVETDLVNPNAGVDVPEAHSPSYWRLTLKILPVLAIIAHYMSLLIHWVYEIRVMPLFKNECSQFWAHMHHQGVREMFYSRFRGKEVHQIQIRNHLASTMNLQGSVRYEGRGKQGKQSMKLRKRNRKTDLWNELRDSSSCLFLGMFEAHLWLSWLFCHHTYVIFLWIPTFQAFHWGWN